MSIIKIIVSFFILIASIKAWNYEKYKIPYIEPYLKTFRKYLSKIEKKNTKFESQNYSKSNITEYQKNYKKN